MTDSKTAKDKLKKLDAFEQKVLKGNKKKDVSKKVQVKKDITKKIKEVVKPKPKKKKPARKLLFSVCNSKKSCGENYGPYIWERLCNENNIDVSVEEFEKNNITYKKSACQGRCKKASNIRVEEAAKEKSTQFSYMTPLKAAKLSKSLNSGAAPENIKKL